MCLVSESLNKFTTIFLLVIGIEINSSLNYLKLFKFIIFNTLYIYTYIYTLY